MSDRSRFFDAIAVLAEYQRFSVVEPATQLVDRDRLVSETARSSQLGYRQVRLTDRWFENDVGPLLGSIGGAPVALVPRSHGGYLVGTDGAHLRKLDHRMANRVDALAYEFCAPLETVSSLRVRDLARFALAGSAHTVRILVLAAMMIGVLGLLSPIAIQHVFSSVIPAGDQTLLIATGVVLAGAAVVSGAFAIVEGFAVNRVALKAQKRLQGAVWHRATTLPVGFYLRFASGELTARILGVNRLKTLLSASAADALLSATFTMFNLILILFFDVVLAAVAFVTVVGIALVSWRSGTRIVRLASDVVAQSRANDAHFSDMVEGLTVIRVSGSEDVFSAQHLTLVSQLIDAQAAQQHQVNRLQLFYATVLVALPGAFFAVVGGFQWDFGSGTSTVPAATFVAFMAAFNSVLGAILSVGALIQPLSQARPILEGIAPILETAPETTTDMADPGPLTGSIELRHVSFRYPQSTREALDDVSFSVEPGQFVALVGPSGAGKSTIVRLLLGFDKPDRGSVLYNDRDLADVDVAAVRHQLGVVLQESRVFAGSIRDNVAGARPASLADVWDAVDHAGLGDEIRGMPMELETMISPNGATFSGGQLQRLMIARALIVRPRILILDEATSSLDDITQDIVARSVDALDVTRIVLAHRVSTIRRADLILVVDGGRLVERGTYDELIDAGGLFTRLVERQVA